MTDRDTGPVPHFVERMGLAAEAEGLPRIAGRIMAWLLAHGEPYSAAGLADALQISRGSVSTNTRLLEHLGIVERTTRPGERQDYYRIADDPYGRLVEGQLDRMRRVESIVSDAIEGLTGTQNGDVQTLRDMRRFYRYAIRNTERFLDGWKQEREGS